MLQTISLILMLLITPGLAAEEQPSAETIPADMDNPGYHEKPDWFKQSFLDIREDVQEASGEGRRVLLYFYQDGCQ